MGRLQILANISLIGLFSHVIRSLARNYLDFGDAVVIGVFFTYRAPLLPPRINYIVLAGFLTSQRPPGHKGDRRVRSPWAGPPGPPSTLSGAVWVR